MVNEPRRRRTDAVRQSKELRAAIRNPLSLDERLDLQDSESADLLELVPDLHADTERSALARSNNNNRRLADIGSRLSTTSDERRPLQAVMQNESLASLSREMGLTRQAVNVHK